MSCPLDRARDVLHAIKCCESLRDWNPPLAVRLANAGHDAATAREHGFALLNARDGGGPGGRRRNRSKAKAARAARRRNR